MNESGGAHDEFIHNLQKGYADFAQSDFQDPDLSNSVHGVQHLSRGVRCSTQLVVQDLDEVPSTVRTRGQDQRHQLGG